MAKSVIVSAARTAVGSFQGALASVPATKLGSLVIKEALRRGGVDPGAVDEVIFGCVLPAGLGQAPARQAALGAGCPVSVSATTINKVCGSGLKAVMLADSMIRAGDAEIVVAGGMENMSRAPYLLPGARDGWRMGPQTAVDSMINDGLWDAYNNCHMGSCADRCGTKYNITREEQDAFAINSYKKALAAQEAGKYRAEILAVEIPQKKGAPVIVDRDEEPGRVNFEKIPKLAPAFNKDGTVTAANASSLNDGAAAIVVMSEAKAKALKLKPMVEIVGHAQFAREPEWFTVAPTGSILRVLKKTGLALKDIDLFELNEAFSVQVMAVAKDLEEVGGLDMSKVNVNGGAAAIGHPIGASGARILTTLLFAMQDRKAKTGLASLCIGGGEAVAVIVRQI
jgi:acetyl-CoA C-acetyltransferase